MTTTASAAAIHPTQESDTACRRRARGGVIDAMHLCRASLVRWGVAADEARGVVALRQVDDDRIGRALRRVVGPQPFAQAARFEPDD